MLDLYAGYIIEVEEGEDDDGGDQDGENGDNGVLVDCDISMEIIN